MTEEFNPFENEVEETETTNIEVPEEELSTPGFGNIKYSTPKDFWGDGALTFEVPLTQPLTPQVVATAIRWWHDVIVPMREEFRGAPTSTPLPGPATPASDKQVSLLQSLLMEREWGPVTLQQFATIGNNLARLPELELTTASLMINELTSQPARGATPPPQAPQAQQVPWPAQAPQAPAPAYGGAPRCPIHTDREMKPSKYGGYYCTAPMGQDTYGKTVYCKEKIR